MIRVLVADDMKLIRGALTNLLDQQPDLEVVAQVYCGRMIVSSALEHRPDIAVLDIDMPGLDGLTAATELRAQLPSCRILILTSLCSVANLRRAMLTAQVGGFLTKDIPPQALTAAIRQVAAGQRVIDPLLAAQALTLPGNPLTPREIAVLRLARGGSTAGEIATELFIARSTVRNYLSTVVAKLNARTLLDAVRIATEEAWL
ncbi:DNA-binding response regulator [Nocardia sp. NPDC051052]|uniref:DNA-binding response regulator n=1 Tax=Nocardia sp. NPDC051052 TaxID=3364322 RepID=UPI0037A6DDCE